MLINLVAGVLLLAILWVVRYAWLNRKINSRVKKLKQVKKERIGKFKAKERNWRS